MNPAVEVALFNQLSPHNAPGLSLTPSGQWIYFRIWEETWSVGLYNVTLEEHGSPLWCVGARRGTGIAPIRQYISLMYGDTGFDIIIERCVSAMAQTYSSNNATEGDLEYIRFNMPREWRRAHLQGYVGWLHFDEEGNIDESLGEQRMLHPH